MNKVILVIDNPKSCDKCEAVDYWPREQEYHCRYLENRYLKNYKEKPIDCPLKPLPQKKEDTSDKYKDYDYETAFNDGFNACIDEILGEIEWK